MHGNFWQLTLVTNKGNIATNSYLEFIESCIKAGITCVQLREKYLAYEEVFNFGRELKELLDFYHIPLIVNDKVKLCTELAASGVHLGQTDINVTHARAALGKNKIIGLSTNTIAHIQNSRTQPINYIGVGAIFPTNNKLNITKLWGIHGLQQAAIESCHPLVAIGGINENNARGVMHAGADGIAAIGAFHDSTDPALTTQNLMQIIQETTNDRYI